jgi:exodeoxyribonuclease-5
MATFSKASKPATPSAESLLDELLERFGHSPTADQYRAFHGIAKFFLTDKPRPVFVLAGAAGTGKTTMVRAIVQFLLEKEIGVVLLAPTGRATRVLAQKVQGGQGAHRLQAKTIHSYIYETDTTAAGIMNFVRRRNDDPEPTVYIVDESSMVGDEHDAVTGSHLLKDLMAYVFDRNAKHQLILLGDQAQLPPVGRAFSPALVPEYLAEHYRVTAGKVTMTEVRRQALDSGILQLATALRAAMDAHLRTPEVALQLPAVPYGQDIIRLGDAEELLDTYARLYNPDALERVTVVCYSNQTAVQVNQQIRNRILGEADVLNAGDRVMAVRNNYRRKDTELPLIANGDVGIVQRVYHDADETRYGQHWLDAKIAFMGADGLLERRYKLPVGLLTSRNAALTREETQAVWQARKGDLLAEQTKKKKTVDLKSDEYVNALQLKFGYCVTGHKAQGGQWEHVLVVVEPYHLNRMLAEEPLTLLRWLYTAVTRASGTLYLYGWPEH